MDTHPVAGRVGGVPLDSVSMPGFGDERQQGLLVLSRLRVDSLARSNEKNEQKMYDDAAAENHQCHFVSLI